ncbi:aldehyde dehydrogenase family protein [Xenophilus arseniciresistens]|uniref:Aldehyde dehydrogenase family protein n=1 Tax=Xenophilus arseniciresistens TaxID=1283306 RepID=A0AAE3N9B8_9BURK|nr:aldehyde dehydrogenase family protein [Xenophilus arseniciresistens]MDA7416919.1 aldehyde dehydrogenase family protein [Xenophilus arseniciresistens]
MMNRLLEVRSPYGGELLATLPTAGEEQVEQALATAQALFRNRDAWLSPTRRIEILRKAVRLMEERADELALEAAREGGKPLLDSQVEVARAIDGVQNCAELLRSEVWHGVPMNINAASAGRVAFTVREPVGVVLAVSAFNHPLNLIVHQVGPALAAGCPVIVKPAAETPLSCLQFVEILREAGLPREWCQPLIIEDTALATRLVADARIGFFSFIGSGRVGWMLRSKLAPGVRCALEHGGVAPVVVAADADLDAAVPRLAKGAFYHAGQVCVSVQRIFAHRSVAAELARRIADLAGAMKVGDPTLAVTEVGPLIRQRDVERVDDWVREAVQGGARLLCGGTPLAHGCYAPTVLLEPPAGARVSTQEVFGPVVCVYAYDDMDEAIARANALPVAFHAAVFTRDHATAMRAYSRLDASTVMINDHTAFRVDWMPFAGLRESGLGVGGIPFTFRDMQTEKMFVGAMP